MRAFALVFRLVLFVVLWRTAGLEAAAVMLTGWFFYRYVLRSRAPLGRVPRGGF